LRGRVACIRRLSSQVGMACETSTLGCRGALAASLGLATADHDGAFAFNANSTAETVTEGLDLSGLTYLVTGATGALGAEVTRVLALRGARVVLACRSQEKGEAVASKILAEIRRDASFPEDADRDARISQALVVIGDLDLGSKESTKKFADAFCARAIPLTGLVCCAGLVCAPFAATPDGRESHFGVNHLGHFFLVHCLLDEVVRTAASSGAQGRIVLVSSGAHHFTYRVRRGVPRPSRGIDFANLDAPVGYDAGRAYAQSKLANVLHAAELDERLRRSGVNVAAFSADPGTMRAELKHFFEAVPFAGGLLFALADGRVSRDARRAAATVVWCAAADRRRLSGRHGGFLAAQRATNYYADCAPRKPSLPARDPRLAKKVWEESERLLGMSPGTARPVMLEVSDPLGETSGGGGVVAAPRVASMASRQRGGDRASGDSMETDAAGGSSSSRARVETSGSPVSPAIRVTPSKSGRWGLGNASAKASGE